MTEVKTTFAAHGNPWAQLIKPEPTPKPKMQKQAKQTVKPAGKTAVKTGQPAANTHTPESVANDGWVQWTGGKCPVEPGRLVEVKLRTGITLLGKAMLDSGLFNANWQHETHTSRKFDITAYRLIKRQSGKQATPKLSAAQASARIDPEKLVVTDMPFPGRTVSLVSKYAAKFATLPVNHRLVCESQDAPAISTSLKKWAEKNKPGHVARHVRDCGDGMGGVWLLKDDAKK